MRLSVDEQNTIVTTFRKHFGPDDHLWLFGSRTDDNKRGGDIDLYIETVQTDLDKTTQLRTKFVVELWEILGEQKIDVVLNLIKNNEDLLIYRMARKTGIQLA
jgi:hypothetical protein